MSNVTFIGFSLIGFVIFFILLLILPRLKAKKGDHSIAQSTSRSTRQQTTGPNRSYKI